MDLNMPVTLVVKAPNQKIDDQTIECGLGWTIKKLKTHLSSVYPSKPRETQQKLIYSGQLLNDNVVLKDVLRKYEDEQTTHTVHLVCSQPPYEQYSHSRTDTYKSNAHVPSPHPEGVRHRHPQPSSENSPQASNMRQSTPEPVAMSTATTTAAPAPAAPPAMPQMYQGAFPQMAPGMEGMMQYGGFYPGAFTPEQMAWMQQMYSQQMAQFMQFYQHGATVPPTAPFGHPAGAQAPLDGGVAHPAQPQPQAANAAPRDQPIRMNAQGGAVLDDDGDGGNRDWLDWLYMISRFGVLLSIVYFYSTFSRFLVVFGFFFFIYVHQAMWRQMRRVRENRRLVQRQQQQQQQQQQDQQVPQNPAPPEPPAQAAAPPPDAAETNDNEQHDTDESDSSAETATPAEPETPAQPPPPGGAQLFWSFITTFFSSLIPAQPAVVNAN